MAGMEEKLERLVVAELCLMKNGSGLSGSSVPYIAEVAGLRKQPFIGVVTHASRLYRAASMWTGG